MLGMISQQNQIKEKEMMTGVDFSKHCSQCTHISLPCLWLRLHFCGRGMSEETVSSLLTYRSGDISETTLMELSSDILNSWNKTHSGIFLVLQYDEKG